MLLVSVCTVMSQNDGHVLLLVCGDAHQHGWQFEGDEAEGDILPRLAALSQDGR